jgi:BirA family biotin operon repressor/biotin-[acetyl-CoA-carboxylase] ligase
MFTANAVTSFLQTLLPPERLRIKWPNDLYFDDKKIGGILIHNNLKKERIDSTVIGIGLNIQQTCFDPRLPNPTSLTLETGKIYHLNPLKLSLYQSLNEFYHLLITKDFRSLKQFYESNLYHKGLETIIHVRSGKYSGIILGIEADGRLRMNIGEKIVKLTH